MLWRSSKCAHNSPALLSNAVVAAVMSQGADYDHLLKILLVGDSAVGKSALLVRFTSNTFDEQHQPTIGVDFQVKRFVAPGGTTCRLNIWDTAGQERFRTLTSSYYRGAQAIVYVFDVTRRETLDSLEDVWMPEVDTYKTLEHPAVMVVGNKADLAESREVSTSDGLNFARQHSCLYAETSAKSGAAVSQAFEELVLKILDSPELLAGKGKAGMALKGGNDEDARPSSCC